MNIGMVLNVGKTVGNVVVDHSPQILVGLGIAGGIATTAMACKATLKIDEVSREHTAQRAEIEALENAMNDGGVDSITMENGDVYTREDIKNDRTTLVAHSIGTVVREYGPVAAMGAASVASILCGFRVLNTRYLAMGAAYLTLSEETMRYRGRVIAEQGEEADWRYRTGVVEKKIEAEVEDEKTGKIKKKKVMAPVVAEQEDPVGYAINYLREATWLSDHKDMQRIMADINMIEASANTILKAEKMMTLNDIRRMLHLWPTTTGQFVGWTMDGSGDCTIDLRARVVYDEELGHDTIILDPNVDGFMVHKIDSVVKNMRGF